MSKNWKKLNFKNLPHSVRQNLVSRFARNKIGSIKNKYLLLSFLIVFLLISVYIYKALLRPGLILLSDFTKGRYLNDFLSHSLLYSWNDKIGASNATQLAELSIFLSVLPLVLAGIKVYSTTFYFIFFAFFSTLSGISVLLLLNYLFRLKEKRDRAYYLIIFACSLFYILSTYVVEHVGHPTIAWAFYLSPLIFFTLIKGINENKKKYLLSSVILWSLAASDIHWVIFGGIIFFGYIVYEAVYVGGAALKIAKKISLNCLFVFGIFLLLNSYYLIPILLSSGGTFYGEEITRYSIQILFRNATFSNIMAMKGNFFLDYAYGELPSFLSFLKGVNLNLLLVGLTAVGLMSMLVRGRFKEHLFFGLLFFGAVFLSAGPNIAPGLFNWFLFEAPLSLYYRRVFRTPKFHQFLILALTPMIGATGLWLNHFFEKKGARISKIVPFVFLGIVVLCSVFPNYPLLTGDFNGSLKPVDLPRDYQKSVDYLRQDKSEHRVLWGPSYRGQPSLWHNKGIGDLFWQISSKPSPRVEDFLDLLLFAYRWEHSCLLFDGKTGNISDFLSPLNFKYLIIHNDIPLLKDETKTALSYLKKQQGLDMKQENGFISVFEVEEPADIIRAIPLNIDVLEGLKRHNSLTYAPGFIPNRTGIFYRSPQEILLSPTPSEILVTGNGLPPIDLTDGEQIRLELFRKILAYAPEQAWSGTVIYSSDFKECLEKRNLSVPSQFPFGAEVIFTWANDFLEIPFVIKEEQDYRLFIRYLPNREGGEMGIYLNGRTISIETKREGVDEFVWKDLGEFNLEGGVNKIFLQNVDGFNAVNLLVFMPQDRYLIGKEKIRAALESKKMIYVLEGETDFYRIHSESRKYLEASNGSLIRMSKEAKVWRGLRIARAGDYRVALRGKGGFELGIGDKVFKVYPNGLDDLTYTPLFSLDEGNHILEIRPLNKNAELDVVWLYSAVKDQTLEQVLGVQEEPFTGLVYEKINPTFWRARINASMPFMLGFAESYDPLWEARICKNGEEISVVKSRALNSIINGFWIEETGDLEIEIRYKPQDWFEIGLWISGITFLGCLGFLGWGLTSKQEIEERWLRRFILLFL